MFVPLQAMVLAGDGDVVAGGATRGAVKAGDLLAAGARVRSAAVEVVLLHDWADGSYRRLQAFIEMVIREREGAERDASGVSDRLAAYTLLVSGAVFGFTRSLRRTSSTLQADFGSALGLVTPVAVETAIASAAAGGVLFRSGAALSRLAEVDCVVFDKTGTLSDSHWYLEGVVVGDGVSAERATELFSQILIQCLRPPVAQACDRAELPAPTMLTHREVQEISAQGLQLQRDECGLSVMTAAQAHDRLGVDSARKIPRVHGSRLRLCLLEDGVGIAEFIYANPTAEGAAPLIEELRAAGIAEIHMITNESEREIPAELHDLDLDGSHAGLDELDKQQFIADLEARGRRVALVSDGLFQARGECLSVCLAASPDYRQLDADVWLLWPDLAGIAMAHKIARNAARMLDRSQRGNLLGNGAVLLAASFDLISSTTAAAISNAITLGLLQRSRELDGGAFR
jgi:Cu2+-exporting ATPase